MAKILVTGGCGLLGSSLVPYLRDIGHDVTAVSRRGKCNYVSDLIDPVQVGQLLESLMPEVIINLVALTNVDFCEENPQSAYLTNVKVVENISNWIKQKTKNSCYLIHISTDQVYDGVGPHIEESVTLKNYYSFSKYASELVSMSVKSTVLRTNFFGASKIEGRDSLSDWLFKSLSSKKEITVFNDIFFSPLSIFTLIELIGLVVDKRYPGIFNLGSKEGMSKAEFSFALAKILGLQSNSMTRGSSSKFNFLASRPKDMRMNSSYFEEVYQVRLPTLFEEIQSTRECYVK